MSADKGFEEWYHENWFHQPRGWRSHFDYGKDVWLASRKAAMEESELKLKTALEALQAIRDSTFRSAITLRSIADSAIQNIGNQFNKDC